MGLPAGYTTLGQVRLSAQQRADLENSPLLTTPEWNANIGRSQQDLHGILSQSYGDDYKMSAFPFFTTTAGGPYPLPLDFFKLRGVDWTPQQGQPITLKRFVFSNRNKYNQYNLGYIPPNGFATVRYDVVGDAIWLRPNPQPNQPMTIWYTPRVRPAQDQLQILAGANLSDWLTIQSWAGLDNSQAQAGTLVCAPREWTAGETISAGDRRRNASGNLYEAASGGVTGSVEITGGVSFASGATSTGLNFSLTITPDPGFTVNALAGFTLIDQAGAAFQIVSNTSNELTLATETPSGGYWFIFTPLPTDGSVSWNWIGELPLNAQPWQPDTTYPVGQPVLVPVGDPVAGAQQGRLYFSTGPGTTGTTPPNSTWVFDGMPPPPDGSIIWAYAGFGPVPNAPFDWDPDPGATAANLVALLNESPSPFLDVTVSGTNGLVTISFNDYATANGGSINDATGSYLPNTPSGILLYDAFITNIIDPVNGWEEFLIVDAALKAATKENNPDTMGPLTQRLAELRQRITDEAANRDAGEPMTVTNVYDQNGYGQYGGGGY